MSYAEKLYYQHVTVWIECDNDASGLVDRQLIGHLHDGVILLQRPEYFAYFHSYSDFYSLWGLVKQLALIKLQKKVGKTFW